MMINTLLGVKANLFFIFALFLINIYFIFHTWEEIWGDKNMIPCHPPLFLVNKIPNMPVWLMWCWCYTWRRAYFNLLGLYCWRKDRGWQQMQKLHCEILQTAAVKCWRMTAMQDKPVCFAIRGGVVKGDRARAVFRGWKPSGEENRSIFCGQEPNLFLPSATYLYVN